MDEFSQVRQPKYLGHPKHHVSVLGGAEVHPEHTRQELLEQDCVEQQVVCDEILPENNNIEIYMIISIYPSIYLNQVKLECQYLRAYTNGPKTSHYELENNLKVTKI